MSNVGARAKRESHAVPVRSADFDSANGVTSADFDSAAVVAQSAKYPPVTATDVVTAYVVVRQPPSQFNGELVTGGLVAMECEVPLSACTVKGKTAPGHAWEATARIAQWLEQRFSRGGK